MVVVIQSNNRIKTNFFVVQPPVIKYAIKHTFQSTRTYRVPALSRSLSATFKIIYVLSFVQSSECSTLSTYCSDRHRCVNFVLIVDFIGRVRRHVHATPVIHYHITKMIKSIRIRAIF